MRIRAIELDGRIGDRRSSEMDRELRRLIQISTDRDGHETIARNYDPTAGCVARHNHGPVSIGMTNAMCVVNHSIYVVDAWRETRDVPRVGARLRTDRQPQTIDNQVTGQPRIGS